MNPKRIRKAMARTFERAREALKNARECQEAGYIIGLRASLEVVAECRKLNADRRRALRENKTI